ncbi:MAG TPA: DNA polymerase III subunit gamma/tau [Thermoanaerobaculia bacterium]|nr:DNA polymerase III subunit gamma/tau [Thermoanaerobaculia bacterium]
MAYQALARKYRPQSFRDIVGQETTVRTLQNAIEQKRVHHAYLFAGVRGIGKTTAARILAKALNCVHGPTSEPCNECVNCREITEGIDLDVREIDAATYTGVDNIRELRDVTQFQPARDRYRIFIIDEAHMLSAGAWNALLKILEEPPPHVIFMFATTEIHKVPATIISRVQKLLLRKITLEELIERLRMISKDEGIEAGKGALEIVARRGEGSVRDALSLLDQIIAFSGRTIDAADVATILGLSDTTFFARMVTLIAEGDHGGILDALQEASEGGRDFKMLYRDLLGFVRNLLLISGGANVAMLALSPEDLATVRSAAERFSYTEILRIANLLLRDDETVNRAEHQRLAVEIALLKAATFPRLRSIEQVIQQGGGVAPASSRSGYSAAAPTKTRTLPAEDEPRAANPPRPPREARAERTPRVNPELPAAASGDIGELVDRVQRARPLLGGYLISAKSMRKDGGRVVFVFDSSDSFQAEQISEAASEIAGIAATLWGESMTVEVVSTDQPGRRADQPATLREDPVVKAFTKHLGGEIVEPKTR